MMINRWDPDKDADGTVRLWKRTPGAISARATARRQTEDFDSAHRLLLITLTAAAGLIIMLGLII